MTTQADRERIERNLETHFMRIVNMLRDGITDDEIRVTAGFCGLPEWVILRLGHDIHVLAPEQEERYQRLLKILDERDSE